MSNRKAMSNKIDTVSAREKKVLQYIVYVFISHYQPKFGVFFVLYYF